MRSIWKSIAVAALVILFTGPAMASSNGTAEEAVAMVERAISLHDSRGFDAAKTAIMDPNNQDFIDRDLYVFAMDMEGNIVAHGANHDLVGRNLYNVRDTNGVYMIRQFIEVVKSGREGWVDYMWANPQTGTIDAKSSFVKAMGPYVVGVGIYR